MCDDYESSLDRARTQCEHIYQGYEWESLTNLDRWMRDETNTLEGYIKEAESEAEALVSELRDRVAELESKVEED